MAYNRKANIGGIIPVKLLQQALVPYYAGNLDGDAGPATIKAVKVLLGATKLKVNPGWKTVWKEPRLLVAAAQVMAHSAGIDAGAIDGLVGETTRVAFDMYIRGQKPTDNPRLIALPPKVTTGPYPIGTRGTKWPLQRDVPKFFGAMGDNQTYIKPAWPMVLSYDKSKKVGKISLHEKVAPSAERVLKRIAEHYSPEQIINMGLHLHGGTLNVRKMRGGNSWSMHSWGIAWDFDPDRNQLKWGRDQARLAKPDAEQFWKFWEEEGWVSLGRAMNYDWMHIQAANVK